MYVIRLISWRSDGLTYGVGGYFTRDPRYMRMFYSLEAAEEVASRLDNVKIYEIGTPQKKHSSLERQLQGLIRRNDA